MTITEAKELVNAILDMNGKDDFTYSPWVSISNDDSILFVCSICNKKTGDAHNVVDFNGDILRRIDMAKKSMSDRREEYIARRKVRLAEELKKLEETE